MFVLCAHDYNGRVRHPHDANGDKHPDVASDTGLQGRRGAERGQCGYPGEMGIYNGCCMSRSVVLQSPGVIVVGRKGLCRRAEAGK